MNILIFGASGGTGHELVKQALAQDHVVTAFVRTPSKLAIKHKNLKLAEGNVADYARVEKAIGGQDAVLSALGAATPFKRDPVLIEGIGNIVSAMQQSGVKRFIYLSFIGVSESRKEAGFIIDQILTPFLHSSVIDHEEKEKLIKSSGLNWTIVRPPKLTNGRKKGRYRSGMNLAPTSIIPTFSRADLADFMLQLATDNRFVQQAPSVMY